MTQSNSTAIISADIQERVKADFEKFEELRGFL